MTARALGQFTLRMLTVLAIVPIFGACKPQSAYLAARKAGLSQFQRTGHVDSEFLGLVQRFEFYYGGSIGDVSVRFGPSETAAACVTSWQGTKVVNVNHEIWNSFGEIDNAIDRREIVIFHELGHCVLDQTEHRNDRFDHHINGKPISYPGSIMSAVLTQEDMDIIMRNKLIYMKELFQGTAVTDSPTLL